MIRNRAPEEVDSAQSARATVAIFAGLSVLLLFFLQMLTAGVGLIIVGLASLIYGLIGLILVFRHQGGIVESIFFILIGLLMLYTEVAGRTAVTWAVNVIGWLSLIDGIGLVAFAFLRRTQNQKAEEERQGHTEEAKTEVKKRVESASDEEIQAATEDVKAAVEEATDQADDATP